MKCFIIPIALIAMIATTPLARGQESNVASGDAAVNAPTLAKLLIDKSAESAKMFPPAILEKIKVGIEVARATEKTAKQVGDAAVDATLTDFDGQSVQLSALWQKGPVVLQWYRGGW